MYYIYILQSKKDKNFYTGYSDDLKNRLKLHNTGKVKSTQNRLPMELVYYEACLNQQDATHREKYLKTAWGKRYIKIRLKNYLSNGVNNKTI
jgi:putative endonuclease